MRGRPLRILQISTRAEAGGAERIARTLHEAFRDRGFQSWMAVGERNVDDPDIFEIQAPRQSRGSRFFRVAARKVAPFVGRIRGAHRMHEALRDLSVSPSFFLDARMGWEYFGYPGTAAISELPPERPDLIHCHNLHGSYFDLRQLPAMSLATPVAVTLHDEWTFTGHCAYSLDSDRWRTGCGSCPHLDSYPAVTRDGTHHNWRVKREIYARSRLHVSAPSRWLIDRARQSVLAGGAASWRVIANGVDRGIFRRADRITARAALGLAPDAVILLFTAHAARRSSFKDYETVLEAARRIKGVLNERHVMLLVLGDEGPSMRTGGLDLRFLPYVSDPRLVAAHYQASDLYLHAAKAENLPTTVLEALAVGLPVVATAVGGIPETVMSLADAPGAWSGVGYSMGQATGILVPPGGAAAMAMAALKIIEDRKLRDGLSANAEADAAMRFDLTRQVDDTLAWYQEIIESSPTQQVG